MSKYKISSKKNIITISRSFYGKKIINEREMELFEKNLLPGFFRPKLEGKHRIVYIAPMSISLSSYIKKNMSIHKFYNILAQSVEIVKKIEMNNFYLYNLVLDSRMIYVKETTSELFFVYEPIISKDNFANIFAFLDDFARSIKTDNRELETECKKFHEYIARPENYRIADIERFITDNYPEIYQQIQKAERGKSGFITADPVSFHNHYNQTTTSQRLPNENYGTTLLSDDEEGTTLLGEDSDGTMLLSEKMSSATLVRKTTGESIGISQGEFLIGKDSNADYCLSDNKAISRRHATIYCKYNDFFIVDENSTNHTYVNGKIVNGEETPLHNEDIIKLADEEFEFNILY